VSTSLYVTTWNTFCFSFDQVRGGDNEIVDLAVAILRALLFRPPPATLKANVTGPSISSRMEEVVPILMDMLDSRDSAARAGVLLVAEFFALYPLHLVRPNRILLSFALQLIS
jgi:hypothetical protein